MFAVCALHASSTALWLYLWVIVSLSAKSNISNINVEILCIPNWIADSKLNRKTFEIINQFRNKAENLLCDVSSTFRILGNYCGWKWHNEWKMETVLFFFLFIEYQFRSFSFIICIRYSDFIKIKFSLWHSFRLFQILMRLFCRHFDSMPFRSFERMFVHSLMFDDASDFHTVSIHCLIQI